MTIRTDKKLNSNSAKRLGGDNNTAGAPGGAIVATRTGYVERISKETQIKLSIDLDSSGTREIETQVPFLTHMLDAFACHGRFSLGVKATGDIEVDAHHLIEDTGIVLGRAIGEALGGADGITGIERAGFFTYPMDGSLAHVAIDICGRANLVWNVELLPGNIGNLDPTLFREFFKGFADGLKATVHVNLQYVDNNHHAVEAIFKALGRGLRLAATRLEDDQLLSTKGMLDQ